MDKAASGSQAVLRCQLCHKPFDRPASLRRHGYYCRSRQTIAKPLKARSCDHCAKLKARCDKARPTCATCMSKHLTCYYTVPPTSRFTDNHGAGPSNLPSTTRASVSTESSSSRSSNGANGQVTLARGVPQDPAQENGTSCSSTQTDHVDWEALARMFNLYPQESAAQPFMQGAAQPVNYAPTPATHNFLSPAPSPIPVISTGRRFQLRSAVWPGAHRVQKMIFHTLRSYTLQIIRNSFPPFIHYSSISPQKGMDEKVLRPIHTCISLMKVRSGKVPGSAELFWRNVAMECEMWCENVFSKDMFELVAAMQALAIYMIVRIDEGETEENNIDELLVRTTVMLSHAMWRIMEKMTAKETDETEWKSWIFQESYRRLCVIYQVLNLLIHFGPATMCEHPEELILSCLPARKELWEAADPMTWQHESEKHARDVTYALDKSGELVPRTDIRELRLGNKALKRDLGTAAWGPQRWDEWCAGADEFSALVMLAAALVDLTLPQLEVYLPALIMSETFPKLGKQDLHLRTDLEDQIYTLDAISSAGTTALLQWAQSLKLEGPKRPGKGEAERTSYRAAFHSPEIASSIASFLQPHLRQIDPSLSAPLCSPNIRVYHYPAGTFFRPHYDTPQLDQHSRKLSCWTVLIYLSTCKGGATRFQLDTEPEKDRKKSRPRAKTTSDTAGETPGLAIEPLAGRILLHWHGNARGGCLRHEGEQVLDGQKWILRTDILA